MRELAHKSADPSKYLNRIADEGRLLASLPAHRHLVKIHDVDFCEGRVFLVLEDVAGQTLITTSRTGRRNRGLGRPVRVGDCAGRSISPTSRELSIRTSNQRNVLIDRDGEPRVIDFGVACSRPWWVNGDAPASIGGTPNLARNRPGGNPDRIGRGTDVFGLGGTLFFMLTGKPSLHRRKPTCSMESSSRNEVFDPKLLDQPGIPPRLHVICLKALAEKPQDRFPTAADLADALERFAAPRRWPFWALLASLFLQSFGLAWGIQHYRHAGRH